MIFGEMVDALLLRGQRVLTNKITKAGYSFKFDNIKAAFANLFRK